ncbi:MAG: OstA-like protein, partial [Candidatus Kapaibacteriota bacterium]
MYRILLLAFLFIILCSPSLHCQNSIILVNADSVIGYVINNAPFRNFIGNVHLRQGNIDLFCNRAVQNLESNSATLSGSVRIVQDTLILVSEYIEFDGNKSFASSPSSIEIKDPQNFLRANFGTYDFKSKVAVFVDSVVYKEKQISIFANKVEYNRNTQVVVCYGNVNVETDSLNLFCDTLTYDKTKNTIFASSNVTTKPKYENILSHSGKLIYERARRYSKNFESPFLLLIDTIKTSDNTENIQLDTLFIFADTLVSENSDNELILSFQNNVKLFKGDLTSVGEFGKIYEKSEWGYLIGKPVVWFDSTELRGDSLFL